jgi:hypothetical protein
MSCENCEENVGYSYLGKPFIVPGRGVDAKTYICGCGQRWWQYNDYYHLWGKVDDDATWANVQKGCPEPVAIGAPCRNLFPPREEG